MNNPMNLNNYVEGAIMAALAAMIALIGIYILPLQIVTVFIWLVPIVVVAVRRGFYTGVLAFVTAAILIIILASPLRAFVYLALYGALGIVLSYYFSKKADFSKIMIVGTLVSAISTAVGMLLFLLVTGLSDIAALIAANFEEAKDNIFIMYENLGLLDRILEVQGVTTVEELRDEMARMFTQALWLIPAIIVIGGMTTTFVNYFIVRKTLQKLNLEVGELPMFRHWQIPWYFIWGVIVGLAFMLYGNFMDWETGSIIGRNILYMLAPILLIQGLAVFVFYYYKWDLSPLIKILLLVIIVLGFPYAIMILLVTGLFDPLFNYRRLDISQKK